MPERDTHYGSGQEMVQGYADAGATILSH